jgi:hypothetical protein
MDSCVIIRSRATGKRNLGVVDGQKNFRPLPLAFFPQRKLNGGALVYNKRRQESQTEILAQMPEGPNSISR